MTTLNQAIRTFNQREATQAALKNEMLTRERVEKLEKKVEGLREAGSIHGEVIAGHLAACQWMHRRLFGRLKWLFFGR